MVKIILEGRLPHEEEYEASCSNCNTRFRFKRNECKEEKFHDDRD